MKKYLFMPLGIMLVTLAACGGGDDATTEEGTGEDQVTITYASWGVAQEGEENLDTLMIEAFMDEHPHINVEIDRSIDGSDWNSSLASAASASEMPDVFSIAEVPLGLSNDWLLDLNEVVNEDSEFNDIPEAVRNAVVYNDSLYAVPSGTQILGYFVNKDLFNQANLDIPAYGLTLDEFSAAIRDTSDVQQGVSGINQIFSIPDWYPSVVDETAGWYTFNEETGYDLASSSFINGVQLAADLANGNYAYDSLSDEQKERFAGDNAEEVWLNGDIALKWDGTWSLEGLTNDAEFDWDFVGIPGGRPVVTNDYLGIASSTEHAEEAYLFSKWMAFGKDGFLKRIELADEAGLVVNKLPVTADQEVLDQFFANIDVPGVEQAYEDMDNAVIEPMKTVPGYVDSRWEAPTGIAIGDEANANIAALIDAAVRGEIKIEDYASQLNDLANNRYEDSKAAID
ncbi:multiple sugar transport system substrate-binding protein [Alkalihalobacillus xiaoxiensis]|uniref:Multiple sugar transport system substrate-binding protein n=1 Tax=Shouchella xiaoxiensis TaxID=766895 RepID=A0ABS2T0R1_9BACI|nr:extracellular solute-binding protein [Shouchella xiaoxiensis]MBM7841085.1 multiple sugar transport system substrate-binding protein [Shouchella xiaoxiensis]